MIVRVFGSPPLVGMKLPSTTQRLGTSWARQSRSRTLDRRVVPEAAGAVLEDGRLARLVTRHISSG